LEDRCKERVEADLAGDSSAEILRVGVGRHQTPRINVSGGASQSAERIANFALRIAASGNLPQSVTDGSANACAVESNADGLSFVIGAARLDVSASDLKSLWRRFEAWTVRADNAADFAGFFEDLNRWGADGQMVIRKTAALLLFAKALVSQVDKMRWEDFWDRLANFLPARREFSGESGRRGYSVTFSKAGAALLFEKEGRTVRLEPEQMQQVWHRFVEWWCLPSPDGADGLAGLDLGAELNGDARFYAFELACLMNEMEQIKALTCGR
jgi:hypothetical protein